jgi:galactosylxylosylprotein 3-beta-galactosyltransferase
MRPPRARCGAGWCAQGCGFLLAHDLVVGLVAQSPSFTFFRVIDVPVGIFLDRLPPEHKARLRIVHLDEVRPYRPLPLFRADTIVQHYMQPEEFKQFHERALAAAHAQSEEAEREQRIAEVYDIFVKAKVMRR